MCATNLPFISRPEAAMAMAESVCTVFAYVAKWTRLDLPVLVTVKDRILIELSF
jgi:hypothetical protein